MEAEIIEAANLGATSDKLYMSAEFNIEALIAMVFDVGANSDFVITGCGSMIGSLQQIIVHEERDYRSPAPQTFLGVPLISDDDVPWGNRIVLYDKDNPDDIAVYILTAYDADPPLTDARTAAAEEALRQL